MIVIEKNEGPKIAYEATVKKLTLGDDELTLNLSKYERDEEVEIDVCIDEDGLLTVGQLSKYYVANIIVPARQYEDDERTIPVAFDMDKVTLILWALEVQTNG